MTRKEYMRLGVEIDKMKLTKTQKELAERIMKLIEERFIKAGLLEGAYQGSRNSDCLSPTRKDGVKTDSSEFEMKNKVKVRTQSASEAADAKRGAPSVGL